MDILDLGMFWRALVVVVVVAAAVAESELQLQNCLSANYLLGSQDLIAGYYLRKSKFLTAADSGSGPYRSTTATTNLISLQTRWMVGSLALVSALTALSERASGDYRAT